MDLKPCPSMCNSTPMVHYHERSTGTRWIVRCPECGGQTDRFLDKQTAELCWNTRPLSDRERALVDASERAEVMMDTCALLGIGWWLRGQYREDWATIHTELIAAIAAYQAPTDGDEEE